MSILRINLLRRIYYYYADKVYFNLLLKIAIPITLQNAVSSSLNMVSSLIIGQKGEIAVAAVGLAGQIFFLLNLLLFGIGSGAAMFTAQLWGKRDVPEIRRVLALSLTLGLLASSVFFAFSKFAPQLILGIYSEDPAVILAGSEYLSIFSFSFFFFAVTFAYALVLRSVGEVKAPVIVSISALTINAILTYGLVFGFFGMPELGLRGAAFAMVMARALECIALVGYTYLVRSPAAAGLHDFYRINFAFIGRILKPVLPVIANEFLWSLGVTAYYVIYAHMGTDSLAAMNIVSTIDQMALVILFGLTSGTAVIVGNRIGAREVDEAFLYGGRSLGLAALVGALIGIAVILVSPFILSLYKVGPEVIYLAQRTLIYLGCFIWLRGMNSINIVGNLRAGGDTTYSLILDGFIIWIVGVPLTAMAAFVLNLPLYYVYLFVLSEEFLKCVLGLRRYFSRRWIHDLTLANV